MVEEKERRIYYQDIVYTVCNFLDKIDGKRTGRNGIVCGTADSPSRAVQDRMELLVQELKELREKANG